MPTVQSLSNRLNARLNINIDLSKGINRTLKFDLEAEHQLSMGNSGVSYQKTQCLGDLKNNRIAVGFDTGDINIYQYE